MEKLGLMFSIMRSKSYVVLTDKKAVVQIPMIRPDSFENIMLLGAQGAALEEFYDRLGDVIKEHEEAVSLLSRRKKKGATKRKR